MFPPRHPLYFYTGRNEKSVLIKGLPRNDVLMLTGPVAKERDSWSISLFPPKDQQKYINARVTFTTARDAAMFITKWHKKIPPKSDNNLTIVYWEEKATSSKSHFPSSEPIPESNSVIIKGLPIRITVADLIHFVQEEIARGKAGQPLIQIYQPQGEYRSARIIFKTIQDAKSFINRCNKTNFEQNSRSPNKLTIQFYRDQKASSSKIDKELGKKMRPVETSSSVIVKGLPENVNEDYILSFVKQPIAKGNKGKHKVTVFDGYGSARITFQSLEAAKEFIEKYNHKPPPGYTNKLTIQYYQEREAPKPLSSPLVIDKHSDKARTIVRNVVYIQGLQKSIDKEQLIEMVERYTEKKPIKVKIYRYPDGKSEGRGTITFREADDATQCIEILDGTTCEELEVAIKMSLFESTKIRRLPGAVNNEHLFENNSVASAYNCIACFETWDERNMIGCVPIGHHNENQIHFQCQDCVRRYCHSLQVVGQLAEGGTGLKCGAIGCQRVFLWAPVKRILTDDNTASRLDQRITADALRDIEGIEYCKEDCGYGVFLEAAPERMQFFSCQNPRCMAQFCRICKISFTQHVGRTCDEVDPNRQKKGIEAELENHLSASKIRICAKCKLRFTKDDDGTCNLMTCTDCHTTMCYICGATNISAAHFSTGGCNQMEKTTVVDNRNYNNALQDAQRNKNLQKQLAGLRMN